MELKLFESLSSCDQNRLPRENRGLSSCMLLPLLVLLILATEGVFEVFGVQPGDLLTTTIDPPISFFTCSITCGFASYPEASVT